MSTSRYFPAQRLSLAAALALWLLPFGSGLAAEEKAPLQPIDTSSPRTTLQGFLEFMDTAYAKGSGIIHEYLGSTQLYLSPGEMQLVAKTRFDLDSAERALDLSEVPPAMLQQLSRRLAVQLREVMHRIELPPLDSVPDAKAMASAEFKRWTLPGTEIRIVRMESGTRSGEYLFGPETVSRIPDFYERVKDLPSKTSAPGGLYQFMYYQPSGVALALRNIVPPRWLLNPPAWAMVSYLDQPVWRWLGIAVVLGLGLGFVRLCFGISERWVGETPASERWTEVIKPIGLVIAAPVAAQVMAEVLRVSGNVNEVLTLSLWGLFYLALTWAAWLAGGALAESLVESERLQSSSIDSQLIRLVLRLVTTILAVAILVIGGDRVGLPAYSVVAGLGVGGLAVALAAQQTLANLLGSLIIMFEKPFAIGHLIKVDGVEGTVENVGFRSTRIRTTYDSLVTIPSSQLVNSTVDNIEMRAGRQVRTTLGLVYGTPPDKLAAFTAGVEQIIRDDPETRKDPVQVVFHDFGASSLDILVNFFLVSPNRGEELEARQRILLKILNLAETLGVSFAFPTQTLHVESLPQPPK